MRVEDLQGIMSGAGTLRHGYQVVWNGTRASASGTPYLASDEIPATPRPTETRRLLAVLRSKLKASLMAEMSANGPQTIRSLSERVGGRFGAVKLAVYNLKKSGHVCECGSVTVQGRNFGGRAVKLYGLSA